MALPGEYASDPLGLGRPPRALVVDDDDDTRDMFELLLGTLGWTVTVARSADDAIERFDPAATDVILTDIGLPEMDGYEMLARLRSRAARHIPAIAITGYGTADHAGRASDAGFDGFLTKPFQLAALFDLLLAIAKKRQ